MNESRTFRAGRTVQHSRPAHLNWICQRIFLPLTAVVLLIALPYGLYSAEWYYRHLALAFEELDGPVVHLAHLPSHGLGDLVGHPVYYSSNWSGAAFDPAFGLTLDHALRLSRETEFCQWREWSSERCDKCRDDSNNEYDCK